ncbi:uncharacterized protein C15orf39 homolog isoform X2 [Elgaria multicarinata webbii]|uniref:uncharacterized protein C15orf39 homolog isoform X2 n=1 Tax=Elgaria multicarinata webbii TaxID=159646 RepID=UPI002FCCF20B
MAEKRRLEAVGTVGYSKLPRLEAEPGHVLTAGLYRSSVLPGHVSENHYGYKGSYFAYPLQCHEGPKSLAHWTPAEAYAHCAAGGLGQQLRMEKAFDRLYKLETDSFGAQSQTPRHKKDSECTAQDLLAAQERWATYMAPAGLVQPGWIHSYSAQQPPRAPTSCAQTLAVPKPVYRNHVYTADSSYSPNGSLVLGTLPEGPVKRPPGLEWALPPSGPSGCADSPSYSTTGPKKALVPESGFPQSPKDTAANPASFSPYHKAVEKCQGVQNTSFPEGSFSAMYNGQKTFPEARGGSPGKRAWAKLPPASPLANPQTLVYQDRSPACYPFTSYPLTSHEQMLLYQQSYAQAEKANALFALPGCKGFRYSEEPQLFPASYFPPAARGYYPLDNYLYRAVGPPMTPPGLRSSKEHEHQQNPRAKTDSLQKTPAPACAPPEKGARCGSWPSGDGLPDWREGGRFARQANESLQGQRAVPHPHSFQPLHSADRTPGFFGGFGLTPEAGCGSVLCHSEKAGAREAHLSYATQRSASSSEAKKRNVGDHKAELGPCIVISDSPVATHESCSKGDPTKSVPEGSGASLQSTPQSPEGRSRTANQRPEDFPSPSSPPMPVINNVFSLAPYQEYLEDSTESVEIPLPKSCRSEEASLHHTGQSPGRQGSPRPDSAGPPEASGVLQPGRKGTACHGTMGVGQRDPGSNCAGLETVGGDCAGTLENYRVKLLPPQEPAPGQPALMGCANSRTGQHAPEDHVLDLSFKTEGLAEAPSFQMSPGTTEALERENSGGKGQEMGGQPANQQDSLLETNLQLSEVPLKSFSGGRSNFHSSAAFLYKKFKILKPRVAGAGCAVQQKSSPSFQFCSPVAALGDDSSLRHGSDQAATQQSCPPVQQCLQQTVTQQSHPPVQQSLQQTAIQQSHSPVQQSLQQTVTQQSHPPVQQSLQQTAIQQSHSPVQQSLQQTVTQQSHPPVQQSLQQTAIQQSHSPVQQSLQQTVTQQSHLPVQQSLQQTATQQSCPPVQQSLQQTATQPETQPLQQQFNAKLPSASKALIPSVRAGSPGLGEARVLLPTHDESLGQQNSPRQYFTALHASVCTIISSSVSASSPEQLKEWLEKAESDRELQEKAASLTKHKSTSRTVSEAPKLSKSKLIWLAFKDMTVHLNKLLSQLDTFLFTRKCPFPHVVRAGAIFIPIHVVKEKLFPHLPGGSVDHVLQDHKVELRPTTLSEEKLLRDLELKSCTSRMLKLLALKQLPDIYPDLLNLHWHDCVKQQLGPSSQAGPHASK